MKSQFHPKVLDENVTDVTSGDNHSVILKTDGSLWSVGHDGEGRLGNGGNDSMNPNFKNCGWKCDSYFNFFQAYIVH